MCHLSKRKISRAAAGTRQEYVAFCLVHFTHPDFCRLFLEGQADQELLVCFLSKLMKTSGRISSNGEEDDMGLDVRKPVFSVCKQQRRRPATHPRRPISAFVIRFLESIISKLATSEISIF